MSYVNGLSHIPLRVVPVTRTLMMEQVTVNVMKVLWFQSTEYAVHYSGQEPRHLANDKLPFRLIEIVYGNFKIELENNEE